MTTSYVERECVNCGSGPDGHRTIITTAVSHNCHLRGNKISTVVCQRCGLVFLNPAPTTRRQQTTMSLQPRAKRLTLPEAGTGFTPWWRVCAVLSDECAKRVRVANR